MCNKVSVDIDPLIRQAIEAVRVLVDTHQQLSSVAARPQSAKLLADLVWLVEVFNKLLHNAATCSCERGQGLLAATEVSDGSVAELLETCVDRRIAGPLPNGPSLAPVLEGPDRSDGGIGIGLAMVAHLVRLHGGTVQVCSTGRGHESRLIVRLPALPSLDAAESAAERCAEQDSHRVIGMSDE